jgi:hypothetical protein
MTEYDEAAWDVPPDDHYFEREYEDLSEPGPWLPVVTQAGRTVGLTANGEIEAETVEWEEDDELVSEEDGPLRASGERSRVIVGRHVFRRRNGRPVENSKAALRRRAQVVGAFLGTTPTAARGDDLPLERLADGTLPPPQIRTDEARTPSRIIIEHRSFAPGTQPSDPSGPAATAGPGEAAQPGETALTGGTPGSGDTESTLLGVLAPTPLGLISLVGGPEADDAPAQSTTPPAARLDEPRGPEADAAPDRNDIPVPGRAKSPAVTPATGEVPTPAEAPTTAGVATTAGVPNAAGVPASAGVPAAVEDSERDPDVVAARQVVGTLAQAMRCGPEAFDDSIAVLVDIVREGGWTAPTLATHLVHMVVGGVKVGSDSPGDNLAWRLKHLPRTSGQCPCAACRSWRNEVATRPDGPASSRLARLNSTKPGPDRVDLTTPPVLPDMAEIERAAAIGAQQAALLAAARAS